MKNHQRSIMISVGILAVVALGYFVFTNDKQNFNWKESYTQNEKDPYDTYVISEMLNSYFPKGDFEIMDSDIVESLPLDPEKVSSFVFIGNVFYLDSLDQEVITQFVANGNHAFVSASEVPWDFILGLYTRDCEKSSEYVEEEDDTFSFPEGYEDNYWGGYNYYYSKKADMQFSHPNLIVEEEFQFVHRLRNKEQKYSWKFIDESTFCKYGMDYEILGRIGLDSINFIRIPHGEGHFYLHTTPIVFTNYQMVKENGLAYAGKAFSHLPQGKIYWDEDSKIPDFRDYNSPRTFSQSPLQYILSQKSLKWSWYTGLLLVSLYVLFRAKRRQRIIPIIEENTNTSLEYIRTIGRLYYQQNEHKKLAHQEMKLFLYYLRDHYNIPTQNLDDAMVQKVAKKSEVPAEEIKTILKTWKKIDKSPSISEHTLIFFHGKVEDFYRNSK